MPINYAICIIAAPQVTSDNSLYNPFIRIIISVMYFNLISYKDQISLAHRVVTVDMCQ